MDEQWKSFTPHYEISNLGNCRRKFKNGKYKLINGSIKKNNGYRYIQVYPEGQRKNHYIHTLVLKHFVGDRPEGLCIDHKDRNRLNNCLENLHYVSYSENTKNSARFDKPLE